MTASGPTSDSAFGPDEPVEPFACPRCATTVTERFWGPCRACRAELAAAYGSAGAAEVVVESTRFEPSMHVVPNHVATKD